MDTCTRWAPTRAQAAARCRTPRALTSIARSGSASQPSTSVQAAQLTTAVGAAAATACSTEWRSARSHIAVVEGDHVVVGQGGRGVSPRQRRREPPETVGGHLRADLPAGAGHQDAHRTAAPITPSGRAGPPAGAGAEEGVDPLAVVVVGAAVVGVVEAGAAA